MRSLAPSAPGPDRNGRVIATVVLAATAAALVPAVAVWVEGLRRGGIGANGAFVWVVFLYSLFGHGLVTAIVLALLFYRVLRPRGLHTWWAVWPLAGGIGALVMATVVARRGLQSLLLGAGAGLAAGVVMWWGGRSAPDHEKKARSLSSLPSE